MRPKHKKALAWAVREAAGWRGSLTGNPDPVPLAKFDANVAAAEEALREIRHAEASRTRLAARIEKVISDLLEHEGAEGFSAGMREEACGVLESLKNINK